jgi:hypothetical protein
MVLPLDRFYSAARSALGQFVIRAAGPASPLRNHHADAHARRNPQDRGITGVLTPGGRAGTDVVSRSILTDARPWRGKFGRLSGSLILALATAVSGGAEVSGQGPDLGSDSDALRVRIEVVGGTHYVGQGFELGVAVMGAGQRPEVAPPAIAGADVWLIRNELRPISISGIGAVVGESNIFVSRFRVVPRRAGTLEIPSIRARLKDRTGRSRPVRVTVGPVPPEGRPAGFLGGVGRFTLGAEASPRSVRVGQELDYRITVTGPAAWGMTGRPELKHFDRLGPGLRIDPRPTERQNEPPSRTFVYRLRPTRPGEAVLPPVAIAAFDPGTGRYITRVTPGVPIRVVAVPAFDSGTIPDLGATGGPDAWPTTVMKWAGVVGSALLLSGAAVAIAWVRRRARVAGRIGGPGAARRLAGRTAHRLAAASTQPPQDLALKVGSALIRYLQVADGRPPGALTPDEAREGVARCTGSEELGARAARIVGRCDGLLYRDAPGPPEDPEGFRRDARGLFEALGGHPSSSTPAPG